MKPLHIVGAVVVLVVFVGVFIWVSSLNGTISALEAENERLQGQLALIPEERDEVEQAARAQRTELESEIQRLARERDDAIQRAEAEREALQELERQHARAVQEINQEHEAQLEAQMTIIRETQDALDTDDGPVARVLRDTLDRLRELTANATAG